MERVFLLEELVSQNSFPSYRRLYEAFDPLEVRAELLGTRRGFVDVGLSFVLGQALRRRMQISAEFDEEKGGLKYFISGDGVFVNESSINGDRAPLNFGDVVEFPKASEVNVRRVFHNSASIGEIWEKEFEGDEFRKVGSWMDYKGVSGGKSNYTGWKVHVAFSRDEMDKRYNFFQEIKGQLGSNGLNLRCKVQGDLAASSNKFMVFYLGFPGKELEIFRRTYHAFGDDEYSMFAKRVVLNSFMTALYEKASSVVKGLEEALGAYPVSRGSSFEGSFGLRGVKQMPGTLSQSGRLFYGYDHNMPIYKVGASYVSAARRRHNIIKNPDLFCPSEFSLEQDTIDL